MEVFPLEEPIPSGILNGSNPSQLEQMKEWDASLTQLEKVLEAACQRGEDDQPKMASQFCSNSSHVASSTSETFVDPSFYSTKKDFMWKHPGISQSEHLNSKAKKTEDCTVTTMEPDSSNSVRSSNGCSSSKEREISTPPDSPVSDCDLNKKEDSDDESESEAEEMKEKKDKQVKKRRTMFERCNIRDIMLDAELDAETLAAQREEQERIRRLQETQQRAVMEAQQRVILESQQRMFQQQLAQTKPYKPDHSLSKILWENHTNWLAQTKPSNSTLQMNFGHPVFKPNNDVIQLDSSEDEQPSKSPENNVCPATQNENVIDISSSDEDTSDAKSSYKSCRADDDVVMLSDEEGEIEDPNNSGSHTNDVMNQPDSEGRVMVNIGHPEEDPDIFLAPQLARNVKPHQVGGIRFLYSNVVESLERFKTSTGFGCILAHSMGLGKTVQVISFIDIYLRHTSARSVLCIVPINTIQNWMSEFDKWLPQQSCVPEEQVTNGEIRPRNFNIYLLNENYKTTAARAGLIFEWQKSGGVLLMGYEMYRLMALKKLSKKGTRRKKRQREENPIVDIEEDAQALKLLDETYLALVNPGPDLVICDEGHRIKNCQASTSVALKSIRTKRRVVLTGYPLQNSMLEYWCMVDFVRPSYLGTRTEFCNMFDRPIQNGQCIDSTPRDRQLMRFRSHVLHSLLIGFVQRRGHSVLQSSLPRKEEHVLLVRMTPIQRTLYRTFVKNLIYVQNASNPLKLFAVCCKVWNHPDILYNILQNRKTETDDNDLDIELGNLLSATSASGSKINIMRKKRINKDAGTATTPTIPNGFVQEPMVSIRDKLDSSISYDWAIPLMMDYTPGILKNSHKMTVLFSIIEQTLSVGDKLLVFSQSLFTLDLIERFLNQHHVPLRPCDSSNGVGPVKWSKHKNYFRLDGSTSPQDREKLINEFNSNPLISLFLLSTRAGCLGINLIGANRIVVVDASWNPCHDAQAVCRIYRYGQQKPCHIYRIVSDNSLEKRIYDRQVNKQGMSDRVVDELNPESNFTWKEVTTLIHDNENDSPVQDLSSYASQYNDEVLQFLCTHLNECLSKEPFQHESLLLDRKELKLTKHEKRLAKQSYEMEKRASMTGNNYGRSSVTNIFPGNPLMGNVPPFNFQGTNTRHMPWLPPNTSLLPSQSTPLPMQPLSNQVLNALQHRPLAPQVVHSLLRQGVVLQHLTVPSDVNIPGNTAGAQPVIIGAGQEVLVMKTQKGMYLNLPDGRIVAIRLPANDGTTPRSNLAQNAMGQTTAKLFEPTAASRSQHCIGISHQSLQCGGTVFVPPGGNSAVNGPPEVIDLSDDDSDHGEDIAIGNEASSSEIPTSSEQPETDWPTANSTVSSMQYNYNQQTAKQPHIPTETEKPPCEVG